MELLTYIQNNKYKDHIALMPTFETNYMQYERIRHKAPTFSPMGSPDPRNFSRGTREYKLSVNIFDDEFQNIRSGQDIRIIFKGNGEESCFIVKNIKNVVKHNQFLCNYTLTANVLQVIDYTGEEYLCGTIEAY